MNSHLYKDVHDEKPIRIWIVIRTEMCMTKIQKNIESHLYRNVHDENIQPSVLFVYLILLSVLIIHDVTLTFVIMSELHHFTS